jgi:MtaA/CmuA family methyltransferase
MTSLERVRNVVTGQPVDHLPVQPILNKFAARHTGVAYIDYTKDARKLATAQLKIAEEFGIDCLLVRSDFAREVIDIAGQDSIDWTIENGPTVNADRAALLLPVKLREFRVPDPFGGGRLHDRIRAIEILRAKGGAGQSVVGWLSGPFSLAAGLRGLERLKQDLVSDPSFANDLLDFTAEVSVRFADAQIRSGADTIGIGDNAAVGISAQQYEQFLFPRQKRIVEAIKHRHTTALMRLHMCGPTESLLSKMGQLPVDIYDLDSAVDIANARSWLGHGRVILGNVAPKMELLEGPPRKVYDAARKCHEAAGAYHIVAAGCEVLPQTPPENLRSLVRYAQEHQPG